MKNKIIKIVLIIFTVLLIIPSIVYLVKNQTVMGFDTYYNFFIDKNANKIISTIIFLVLFIGMSIIYGVIVKQKPFKAIKEILIYVLIVSAIFAIMLPWTSSDIFYYMGVGELDSRYHQNPYYVTMKDYYNENKNNIDDTIFEQGAKGYWASTTVVYGPMAQLIFKLCTAISFKNVDISLAVFKLLNLAIHLVNCYLIYKLSNKKFAVIYGLNPFILLEFLANVHNDIIVVFFVLLALYMLKHKKIVPSVIFLAIATGIKYFTILLLPVIIIYHFRKEEKLSVRFLKCFQYGILFAVILVLQYALYFRDFQVLVAMFAQTEKYTKSIHSVLLQNSKELLKVVKPILQIAFFGYYVKFCIDLITQKDIKLYKTLRKYNTALILFLLILTTFQQWYLVWLFATIMWQKPDMIRNIVGLSLITEIANSIYMFKSEWYVYDICFVGFIICLFIAWQLNTNKYIFKDRRKQIG